MKKLEYNILKDINSFNSIYVTEDKSFGIIKEIQFNNLLRISALMKPTIINGMFALTFTPISKNELLDYERS